jgi:ribonuclease E
MKVPEPVEERPVRRRSTIREAPPIHSSEETSAPAYVPAAPVTPPSPEPATAQAEDKPRKKGWWSMRG